MDDKSTNHASWDTLPFPDFALVKPPRLRLFWRIYVPIAHLVPRHLIALVKCGALTAHSVEVIPVRVMAARALWLAEERLVRIDPEL